MTPLSEAEVETAALAWRAGLGWRITNGPDITEPWDRLIEVWNQFCTQARIRHAGRMYPPVVQEEFGYELR